MWNWLRPEIPGGDWAAASIARSFITVGAMLLFVFLALPAHAEKGQSSYKQGTEMEARQNYEGAYASYQRAYDVPLQIAYDKQGLRLLNISNGNFLSQGEQVVALVHREDPSSGAVEITASRPPKSQGASGHGVVTTFTFEAKTTGRFPVKITKAALVHPDHLMTAASGSEVTVSVQ